jgi:hypothetical protein
MRLSAVDPVTGKEICVADGENGVIWLDDVLWCMPLLYTDLYVSYEAETPVKIIVRQGILKADMRRESVMYQSVTIQGKVWPVSHGTLLAFRPQPSERKRCSRRICCSLFGF